ncbi:hypothetical protein B0A49_07620 [Cryomyces minteri]|uniref:UDENN domain-containing protein n=1 Tax=Cryomyces minteri TaxID=331657 RepID=A0A4U0WWP1_9PEZI|nr:hypothetical protein B0A49_07620 [Cryomyces minteri]
MKRRFAQKTLVLISTHEFPALFLRLLHQITSSGTIGNPTILEAAYVEMAKWPPPSHGRQQLPFLGSVIELDIAPHASLPLQGLSTTSAATVKSHPSHVYANEPVTSWNSLLRVVPSPTDLYKVSEQVLLCESAVVLAKSPQLCSEFISALVDLIKPVPYAGECRPYLTMQSEFFSASLDGGAPKLFLIGITNPFLLKRVLDMFENAGRAAPLLIILYDTDFPVPLKAPHMHHTSQAEAGLPNGVAVRSRQKTYMKVDRLFLKALEDIQTDTTTAIDSIGPFVRRHFATLVAQFLAPLNRHLATRMATSVLSPGGNLQYAHFNETEFMQSLKKHGSSASTKGQSPFARRASRDQLYRKFCRSPSFYSWLDVKLSLEKEALAALLGPTTLQTVP